VLSWHETVKAYIEGSNLESTAPPQVATAEQSLKSLLLMPMDHVEIPSARDRLDTTVLDAATHSFQEAINRREYVADSEPLAPSVSPPGHSVAKVPPPPQRDVEGGEAWPGWLNGFLSDPSSPFLGSSDPPWAASSNRFPCCSPQRDRLPQDRPSFPSRDTPSRSNEP